MFAMLPLFQENPAVKKILATTICTLLSLAVSQQVSAQTIRFDFQGNGGFGLLPENEVPAVTTSSATGGETGSGLVYDLATNILNVSFNFSGLTNGLADIGNGGIHIHDAGAVDPFGSNGGIVFSLNSGASNVAIGSTSGSIMTSTTALSQSQEDALLNGQFYVNIHSGEFNGGELRGNLVAVPEPSGIALIGAGLVALVARRRR